MRFALRDHQGKGRPFQEALLAAGHTENLWHQESEVVLIDFDLPHRAYSSWVLTAKRHEAPLIIYPHGFCTTWIWGLFGNTIPDVAASLVPGPGQKHLLEAYDYPAPVYIIGWPGERREPSPRECKRVLFAPHHPLGSGYMPPDSMEANAEAYRILLEEPCELVVRHVGTLGQNGLWHEPGVHYIEGRMDGSAQAADVVVAGGTYAATCLTAGVPVVMYDQEREWRLEDEDSPNVTYPDGYEEHLSFTHYPYDLAPGVCALAAEDPNPPDVQEWRECFLGPQFDPTAFARLVEGIVDNHGRRDGHPQESVSRDPGEAALT